MGREAASIRTADIKQARFDASAAQRRWRSPVGRPEGRGAQRRVIRPGEPIYAGLRTLARLRLITVLIRTADINKPGSTTWPQAKLDAGAYRGGGPERSGGFAAQHLA